MGGYGDERRIAVPIGPTELILILVIVLVIFGAGKLPQVFRSLGTGIKEFREAAEGKETPTTTTTTVSNPGAANPPSGATPPETPASETPVTHESIGSGR